MQTTADQATEQVTLSLTLPIELTLERIQWTRSTWLEAYHVFMNGELIGNVSRDAERPTPWGNTSTRCEVDPHREYGDRASAVAALVRAYWQRKH
jgi:hypothetical protein